jgi:glycosyltransferase AglD
LELSVVIACYNEKVVLWDSVSELIKVINGTRYYNSYELIFVDDCSKDNTIDLILDLMGNFPQVKMTLIRHEKNTGRGRTVTDGIEAANGRLVGFLDIDLETPAHYIPAALKELENGYDVVTAQRVYKMIHWTLFYRQILSVGYHKLQHSVLHLPLRDTEVGFKFFRRERILPILKKCQDQGWFWDTEIMARSYFAGLKIKEIPSLFIKRYDKKSTVRILPDTIDYFKKLYLFRREIKKLRQEYQHQQEFGISEESFSKW